MSSVSDILSELSDHGFTDTGTPRKVAAINDTIQDICSREAWPFLEKTITLAFGGSSPVASNFPTDFRAALKLTDTTTGRTLSWARLDDFDESVATTAAQATAGSPTTYYFIGSALYVWPVPPATTTLRLRYLSIPADVTESTDDATLSTIIPRRHHRVITLGALWKLYDMEDDPDLAARFEGHFENRMSTMRNDLWRLQYDATDQVHIIDTDMDTDSY